MFSWTEEDKFLSDDDNHDDFFKIHLTLENVGHHYTYPLGSNSFFGFCDQSSYSILVEYTVSFGEGRGNLNPQSPPLHLPTLIMGKQTKKALVKKMFSAKSLQKKKQDK